VIETETLRVRQAGCRDEAFLLALFGADKAVEFAATGLAEASIRPLIDMQYRGRKMSYTAQYPEAEDSILCLEDGREEETPVGRLLVDRKTDCWRVVDIAVLAHYRGRGLGTAALKECQSKSCAAGVRLELAVRPENPARRLYERLGFHAVSEDAATVQMIWNPAIEDKSE
jgi:ribosomal protein S18 acetylase RimI-like enzyme